MHGAHHFNWIHLIPVLKDLPLHVATAGLVAGVIMLCAFIAGRQTVRRLKSDPDGAILPPPRPTFNNFFEIIAEALFNFTSSIIHEKKYAIHFTPVIGSLFIFIFVSNLLGLIPGLLPPTDNLNTTLALGIFVFIYYNIAGLKANGIGYLKHFMGPVIWLAPLLFFIEVASHLFRPLSLGMRLRGNIMGDHIVLGIFSDLVPYLVPIIFYALGIFVSFVQAFVFCLLTTVYISLSTAHDH